MSRLDINMGVTYKLRKEVVDLIIQKKKENPSLSCRSLTGILREAFQVEVSKSSINAVIKEYELSNPVGRHPSGLSPRRVQAPKNFLIPLEKKEQLLAQVAPFLPDPPQIIEEKKEIAEQIIEIVPKDVIVEKVLEVSAPIKLVNAVEVFETPVLLPGRSVWVGDDTPVMDNGGLFFVRAIMQDIFRRPVIGRVFAGAAGMDPDEADHLEAAVLLQAMGVSSVEDLHALNMDALWAMFDMDAEKGKDLMDRFLGKNLALPSLRLALEVELEAGLVQGSFFKCVSDAGRNFYFSADLVKFLLQPNGDRPTPALKAVELAVDSFFSGRSPLTFDLECLGQQENELFSFLTGHANDRLDKIELWSERSGKVWSRIINVGQAVSFIVKIKATVDVLQKIEFDAIDNPQVFYDADLDARYRLIEGKYLFSEDPAMFLRAIIVEKEGVDEKEVLLINMADPRDGVVILFNKYLQKRCFYSISHGLMGFNRIKDAFSHKNETIYGVLANIFDIFEEIIKNLTLPLGLEKDFLSVFFKIPAKVWRGTKSMHVRFVLDGSFDRSVFQGVVDLVNALCLKDRAGRRFLFSIES